MATETRVIPERVLTEDGSPTYLHPQHKASYRSVKGATTESRWVFLTGSRLLERAGPWRVLELGFGSGLNFQLTAEAAREAGVELHYLALEAEPMPSEFWLVDDEWKTLQFGKALTHGQVHLTVQHAAWQTFSPPRGEFDVIYHDPFGPAVCPESWQAEAFRWAARALSPQGVLATYGASSGARRAMREAGLEVGILPGAPGKREMTVAAHSSSALEHARLWKTKPR